MPPCLISKITFGSQALDQSCSIAPTESDFGFLSALSSENNIDIQLITEKVVWVNYFPESDDIIIQRIESLELDNLDISIIPNSIEKLDSLKLLSISNNQLSQLPYEIASLGELTFLDVSYNQLTELPSTINSLSNLEELRINNNNLTRLRSQIGDLQSLKILRSGFNQITSISSNLSKLTDLSIFWLYQNNKGIIQSKTLSTISSFILAKAYFFQVIPGRR